MHTTRLYWAGVFITLFTTMVAAIGIPSCPANQVCFFYGASLEKTISQKTFSTTGFSCPATAGISVPFSYAHKVNGVLRAHLGIDLNTPAGTEVRAAADGKIIDTPTDYSDLGTVIVVRHSDDPKVETKYGHLLDTNSFRPGDKIAKGQVIGHTGQSGQGTDKPALYFQLDRNGIPQREVEDICKGAYVAPPAAVQIPRTTPSVTQPNSKYSLSQCFQELNQLNPTKSQSETIFRTMADRAAGDYGINPTFFKAQITQESRWKPYAGSPAGAGGLGQFMPGTARDLGIDRFDPAQALCGAAKYDASLYESASGLSYCQGKEYTCTFAGYNAGLGNVEKYRGVPPFKETRDYVAIILGSQAGAT